MIIRFLCGIGLFLPGLSSAFPYEDSQVVVSLEVGHVIEEVNAVWGTTTLDAFPEGNLYLLDATGLGDVELLAAQMANDPAVMEAEANYFHDTPETIRQMVIVIVGGEYVDYEDQTIGARIGLDAAHQMSRGAGVTVAILDTGVDPAHAAIQGRLSPAGYDFVDMDASPWEVANGIDEDQDGIADEGYGHGTMVAGIVALVAPEATLLPVRVLGDEGTGDAYQIAKGIRYAMNQGADVLNLSFGIPRGVSMIRHQLTAARDLGVIIIAGAGNDNLEQRYYPAGEDEAEMITAVDSLDVKAAFADWHSKVSVSAPGTGVRSSYPGGLWAMGAGCSFATPFVSGEAALIRSLLPLETPDEVRMRIQAAVVPIDQLPGNEPYQGKLGSGRLYLPAALEGAASVDESIARRERLRAVPNPSSGDVRIVAPEEFGEFESRVFDSAGRLVRVLDRSDRPTWDGRDHFSRRVPPGTYFVQIRAKDTDLRSRVSILPR
jgi:subtilisin family serine protease